jgi:hypothetical protein
LTPFAYLCSLPAHRRRITIRDIFLTKLHNRLIGRFSNKTLRPRVVGLLDEPNGGHRCYDLRRLRLKGLIVRVEHSKR